MSGLLPVVDVGEQTHLEDTFPHGLALAYRRLGSRSHLLLANELHDSSGDVYLIHLV